MEQLEHPDVTRCLRDGYPNSYSAELEPLDVNEEEFAEIVANRKAPAELQFDKGQR